MTASQKTSPDAPAKATEPLALIDLKAQQQRIRQTVDKAIARVLDHGAYIMGPEVAALEKRLAAFSGARHAVSCASGTDALLMVLMAKGIGPGDAVLCPGFTYTATPEAIALLGATPVFADVQQSTFNLDVESGLTAALETARLKGLRPKVLIAVDLFGQPADYDAINRFADANGLWVLADAAQSFGASYKDRKVGTLAHATATSFFPAKPLGCYGDGGAIFTDDDELAAVLESIRAHGKGADKYDIVRIGINGRLDTIQAAILDAKLDIFPDEIEARDRVAARYDQLLKGCNGIVTPRVPADYRSVWAQYTLRVPPKARDAIAKSLAAAGVPTAVYYPRPVHHQTAYRSYPVPGQGLPVSEQLAQEVLSVPMHPYLTEEQQARVAAALRKAVG